MYFDFSAGARMLCNGIVPLVFYFLFFVQLFIEIFLDHSGHVSLSLSLSLFLLYGLVKMTIIKMMVVGCLSALVMLMPWLF